jgi:hypothetical protein
MYSASAILIFLSSRRWALCALAAVALIGCGREEIKVYNAPKDPIAPVTTTKNAAAASEEPHLHWTLPAGWTEKPAGGMRVGSFSIAGADGQVADVSIIPLGGVAGSELDNINRWRTQVNLEKVTPEGLASLTEKVEIGEFQGTLVDMLGTDPQTQKPTRILGAILPTQGTTWFFKAMGADALVAEQKPAFKQFLKSVTIDTASHQHAATSSEPKAADASTSPASDKPLWDVPAGWQAQPPSSMLLARFAIADKELGKADVTISSFPGDVGGLLANVNRWGSQLGLGAMSEADLAKVTSPMDLNGVKATIVEMESKRAAGGGTSTRMIVAVVPRDGQTWFFKLLGDDRLVAREKPALIKFVESVRYPNG